MVATTAERLKYLMESRGLKQADIVRMAQPYCEKYRIKLGKGDMSQYVSGKVKPAQWKLTILGLALNVSEAWLMGLDVPMKRLDDKPVIMSDDGWEEMAEIFTSLSPKNQAKLVELGHLYLTSQHNSEEKK